MVGVSKGYLPRALRSSKEFNNSFKYPHTAVLSEDEMVEQVWAQAPPGSKLTINTFRVLVLYPGSTTHVQLFHRAYLAQPWNLLADEDPWEFTQRLCELAYGKRDLFTEP